MLQKYLAYQSTHYRIFAHDSETIQRKTRMLFYNIQHHTKRRPYIRSTYFNKEKIFFDYFWIHLNQKPSKERYRRLQFFSCAIDLVKNSTQAPLVKPNPMKTNEILYRFQGISRDGYYFFVQIKKNIKTKQKYLMSCFPEQKNPYQ